MVDLMHSRYIQNSSTLHRFLHYSNRQAFNKMQSPITSVAWSADGTLLAYAASYDWSKGVQHAGTAQPQIMVHQCIETDIKPRPKPAAGRR